VLECEHMWHTHAVPVSMPTSAGTTTAAAAAAAAKPGGVRLRLGLGRLPRAEIKGVSPYFHDWHFLQRFLFVFE
jgi:hypothetical protein